MKKIGAIIQARTSSTRLPSKILKKLPYGSDFVVLNHVIRRTCKSKAIDEVIVATTTSSEDDAIAVLAKQENVHCFRGSRDHVLSRYHDAAKERHLDAVVRITSDCPCIDWEVIDRIVNTFTEGAYDYVNVRQSYPRGVADMEIMTFETLAKAYHEATEGYEIEHVTPYIYRTNPQAFRIASIEAPRCFHFPDIRITLDTPEDYALICGVFDYLYRDDCDFKTEQIIELFKKKPWLKLVNSNVLQKKITDLDGEIAEAIRLLDVQDLKKAKDFLQSQWKR